jgi:hypothetical protein
VSLLVSDVGFYVLMFTVLGSSISRSEHTVVNVGGSEGNMRLVCSIFATCVHQMLTDISTDHLCKSISRLRLEPGYLPSLVRWWWS